MYPDQSGAFCFMGVSSKSAIFLFEKDRDKEAQKEEECQISMQEDLILARLKQQECDLQEDQREKLAKLETPSSSWDESEMVGDGDDYNEGFRTPTSSEHRIPAVLECPGAPRKMKPEAPPAKRKVVSCHRRIDFDMFEELESLFPAPPFVVDLDGGHNNKKVKGCARNDE